MGFFSISLHFLYENIWTCFLRRETFFVNNFPLDPIKLWTKVFFIPFTLYVKLSYFAVLQGILPFRMLRWFEICSSFDCLYLSFLFPSKSLYFGIGLEGIDILGFEPSFLFPFVHLTIKVFSIIHFGFSWLRLWRWE